VRRSVPGHPKVALVFLVAGLLAGLVLGMGLVLALVEGDVRAPFVQPAFGELSARGLLSWGLALLLALPLVRNVAVLAAAMQRGRRGAAALALLVLAALLALYAWLALR
jgi:hypothetical protein